MTEDEINKLLVRLRDRQSLVLGGYMPLAKACEDAANVIEQQRDKIKGLKLLHLDIIHRNSIKS